MQIECLFVDNSLLHTDAVCNREATTGIQRVVIRHVLIHIYIHIALFYIPDWGR